MKRSWEQMPQVATLAVLLTLGGWHSAEATHDPVAYWRFDEAGGTTALDSSGLGHNGSLISTVAYTTSGLPPVAGNVSALSFGNFGWVNVPYHPDFDFGPSDSMTIALWVKPTQFRDPYHVLGKRLGSNINFQLARDAFNLFHFGTNTQALSFGQDLTQNVFTHVAVTYDGATLRLYLDGAEVNNGPFTMDPGPSGTPLEIASTGNGTITRAQNFPGVLDDLRIYRRVLGPSEIAVLAGVPPVCVPPPSGLVSWWPGDGNANDIANGRNGTVVGGAGFVPGQVAQAFSFTGSGWVDVADNPVWTLGTNDFAIDLWVKFNGLSGRDPFIAHDEGGGSTNKWIFWYDAAGHRAPFGPALRLHVNSPTLGAIDPVVYPWTPAVGRWYHVAVTRSGIIYTLYIDGDPVISESDSRPIPDPSARLTIGRAEAYLLNGLVDEVEIHNRALSASEVHSIFLAGIAGKCKAPVADAGPDQSVNEGAGVSLDGSQSSGLNLAFSWVQLIGDPVLLDDPAIAQPSFTAPLLAGGVGGNQTLTFELTVTDFSGLTSRNTVDVTVKNLNNSPVADAGADQNVNEGSPVSLDGSNSYDPDGDGVSCQWNQTCGTAVTLTGDNTCQPSFTAPLLAGGSNETQEILCFEVTVSDGAQLSSDSVQVTVEQVNHPPTADAGSDQTKAEGSIVTLDGTASQDPDGDAITYSWSQVSGPPATLSDATSPTPSFTTPLVGPGGEALTFRLTVNDGSLTSERDEVVITVQNLNDPPACGLAQASPAILWPPNHKMVSISITGVSDSNSDPVTITTTAVTQDEPVNGLGDGDTAPDAVIQGSTTLLRAERAGSGNGRVYRVRFTADDGQGGVCSGAVTVGVPKSMKPGESAIDDGQFYDSTQP